MIMQMTAKYDNTAHEDRNMLHVLAHCISRGAAFMVSDDRRYLLKFADTRGAFTRKDFELAIGVCDQTAAHIENHIDALLSKTGRAPETHKELKMKFDELQTYFVGTLCLMQIKAQAGEK
jgi:hypothetical protein